MGFCCYCKKKESHHESTHFFKFPAKNYTKWVENMGRKNWTPKKSSTLCSSHFSKDCIDYRDRRARLRKGAVPTIFGSLVNDNKLLGGQTFYGEVQTPSSSSSDLQAVLSPSSEVRAVPSPPTETQKLPTTPEIKVTPKTQTCRKRSLQHDHHYIDTPTTLWKKLNAARTRISKFQCEQKVLKQQVKRSKIIIQTMKSVIEKLRQQKMVSNTGLYSLESFETKPVHLFTRIIENKTYHRI